MNGNRFLLMMVALVMITSVIRGQKIAAFNHLSTSQGLLSPKYNNFIYRDGEGLVWVSSIAGVYQFDGERVKSYHTDENDARSILLEVGLQSTMQEDKNGDLWFSAGVALTRYNRRTDDFTHFYHTTAAGDTIRALYQWSYIDSGSGDLFSSAGRKLFAGSIREPHNLKVIDSIFVGNQDYMLQQRGGCYKLIQPKLGERMVVINTYCDLERQRSDTLFGAPDVAVIDAKLEERLGRLLVATSDGLYWVDPKANSWTKLNLALLNGAEITAIEQSGSQQFVIGTKDRGLFLLSKEGQRVEPLLVNSGTDIGVFREQVACLYVDPDQVLWVSTEENGVFYASLVSNKFKHISGADKEENQSVVALTESEDGRLLILFPDRLEVINGPTRSSFMLPAQQSSFDKATSLAVDRRGMIWVGTYSSLLVLEPGQKKFNKSNLCLAGDAECSAGVTSVKELETGELLVTTNADHAYTIAPDLSSTKIWAPVLQRAKVVAFGSQGSALVGTNNDSLILLQLNQQDYEVVSVYLRLGLVTSIIYDEEESSYWIARYGGIHRLGKNDLGEWVLTTIPKTKGEVIAAMEQGNDGSLWFSTPGFLKRYLPQSDSLVSYTVADGIQGNVFNLGASLKLANGTILFGGANGLSAIEEGKLSSRIGVAKPAIVRVKINGGDFLGQGTNADVKNELFLERLRVPYDSTSIEIYISALEYSDPDNCELYYSISEGEETGKRVKVGDSRKVSLERLREGDYTFRLWAVNADGVPAEGYRELLVIVDPPWYRTLWAKIAYALLIIGVTAFIFGIYISGKRKAEREELRAAQAEALTAETETSVLRLQMNPHFIFNSLNSINSYVVKGDKLSAHEYIIAFADVIRDILTRSAQPLTRLDLAIELLKRYLEVEQMRFSGKLSYKVEIAEEVETFTTFIPTMILQPFIENAIKHGISGLKQGGTITLRFRLSASANMLVAIVEDNGRGRAATITKQSKHKSMATDITRQRLELLNKHRVFVPSTAPEAAVKKAKEVLARYEIIDLYTDNGQPCGTRVVLHLPLEYPQYDESSSY